MPNWSAPGGRTPLPGPGEGYAQVGGRLFGGRAGQADLVLDALDAGFQLLELHPVVGLDVGEAADGGLDAVQPLLHP